MNILIFEPHADDAAIGLGGAIARFSDENHFVFSVVVTKRKDLGYRDETKEAFDILGIDGCFFLDYEVRRLFESRQELLDDMLIIKKDIKPNIVFVPSPDDVHQDHSVVSAEAVRAFMDCSLFGYEAPRNEPQTHHSMYYALDKEHIDKKVRAVECYKSQLPSRIQMTGGFIRSLAEIRGAQIGRKYAEAFTVYRYVA